MGRTRSASASGQLPPEPRLQNHPREDLLALRRAEDAVLNSYGWVDRTAGIVRIPIDQAIRRTLNGDSPRGRQPPRTAMRILARRLPVPRRCCGAAAAQPSRATASRVRAGSLRPARALREIGFDQHLGQRVPLETPLIDELGG